MEGNIKCRKIADESSIAEQMIIRIDKDAYALQNATEEEVKAGIRCLDKWYVERKYKTQVAGLGRVYYDMKSEMQELCFEELIFKGGECIGAYHDELVFLFDNEKTHYQKKYLGEMPTGPDQAIEFYDYYYLHFRD